MRNTGTSSSKVSCLAEILTAFICFIIPAAKKHPFPTVHVVRVFRFPTIHQEKLPGRLKCLTMHLLFLFYMDSEQL